MSDAVSEPIDEPRGEEESDVSALEFAQEISTSLAEDPVYIDPAAAGRIPEATVASMRTKAEDAPVDVFVVIVDDSLSMPVARHELDTLLNAHLGADGVYIVADPSSSVNVSLHFDDGEEEAAVGDLLGRGDASVRHGTDGLSSVDDVLDALNGDRPAAAEDGATGADASEVQPAPQNEASGPMSTDTIALAVLVGAVLLAGAVMLIVRAVGRYRAERRTAKPAYALPDALLRSAARLQQQEVRAALDEDGLEIAGRLAALDSDDLDAEQLDVVAHGLDAYDLARRIVDDEQASRADLAGALVLLTVAGHDAAKAEQAVAGGRPAGEGRKGADVLDLCVVDPTHGAATGRARPPGADAAVPVCDRCRSDIGAGRRPEWLTEEGRPYAVGNSVWARTLYGTVGGDLVEMLHGSMGRRER